MSLLLGIWLSAITVIAGILFYAKVSAGRIFIDVANIPRNWGEFVHDELLRVFRDVGRLISRARPHWERGVRVGIVVVKRGHDIFIKRVFGRVNVEKGRASSFYLKQITENRDSQRDVYKKEE